jgi:hypothetical protein
MAERVEGPLTVAETGGKQQTVVSANSLLVGRAAPAAGGGGGTHDENGDVVVGGGQPPAKVADVLVDVGDKGASGGITVRDQDDGAIITLNGETGQLLVGARRGRPGQLVVRSGKNGPLIIIDGSGGRIEFRDDQVNSTLVIDGLRGDIELLGADCAEDFDVVGPTEAGSVLCVDDDGTLRACDVAYDRHVVGVVSGAGNWRPGLRLDRQRSSRPRAPVALAGKVYCLADANQEPIGMGDLLTTSATPGHAMRASDPAKAFGAVLGKSLGALPTGRGLVPTLIALQ